MKRVMIRSVELSDYSTEEGTGQCEKCFETIDKSNRRTR